MILGIDIGGTNIKFGVIADDYSILKSHSIPTGSHRAAEDIVRDIIAAAKALKADYDFDCIGIGSPGDIDGEAGICNRAGNLPYDKTPVGPMVSEALGLPVRLANDATAALYGELYAGAGKDRQNIIMITLGTGVGGGIAIDGKPYFGSQGFGGELGHMIIKYDGLPCPCGMTGCYEQYASVTALVRQIKSAVAQHPDSILSQRFAADPSARALFDAKAAHCPVADAVLEQYTEYIAIGLNSYECIFQPELFILGGAISSQGENLLEPIRTKLRKPTPLVTSHLKNDAGIIGAAVVAKVFLK